MGKGLITLFTLASTNGMTSTRAMNLTLDGVIGRGNGVIATQGVHVRGVRTILEYFMVPLCVQDGYYVNATR